MRSLAFLFTCVFLAMPCEGRIITVDDDGPADFNNIQAAIDAAVDGNTILVFPGTYTGVGNRNINFRGKAITVRSIEPNDPNIVSATIVDCDGALHGFYFRSGEDANSVVAGLTITNGYASGDPPHDGGGAICCYYSSKPAILKCVITSNSADKGGGISGCGGPITDCTIVGNIARMGGGVCGCNGPITNCTISRNGATRGSGGGVCYCNGPITNCTISENRAYKGGGLLGCRGPIINCSIYGNRGRDWGGGLLGCSGITNCIIRGNSASIGAGLQNCQGTIVNCIIEGNWASYAGGGLWSCRGPIANCVVSGNKGAGVGHDHASVKITNSIIWGNIGPEISGSAFVTYSNIEGGWSGEGDIDADPCFVQAGCWDSNGVWVDGDYRLLPASPCIDAGDPNYAAGPNDTDLDGNPRVADGDGDGNSVVDMGAYEFAISEPVEMLAELVETVEQLGLAKGIENSLLAKLEAAVGVLEDDNEKNDGAAVNILGAFINAASAQSGKKIPEAQAEALIAEAMVIIEALGSG